MKRALKLLAITALEIADLRRATTDRKAARELAAIQRDLGTLQVRTLALHERIQDHLARERARRAITR